MHAIIPIIIILITSLIVSHFSNKIGIPAVLGVLVLGVILGPGVLNIIKPTHLIESFAEIGVILLMFIAGLESDLKLLRKFLKPSINVALLGVLLPLVSVFIFNYYFGFPIKENIFIAIVFAATSVSISVEVLKSLNYLSGTTGTVILGAAVADDMIAIFLLSVVTGSMTGSFSILKIVQMVLIWIVFFIFTYFLVTKIIPFLNKLSTNLIASQSSTINAIVICFLTAFLADWVNLDAVLGAFIAGIAYSEVSNSDEINKSIQTIGYSIFIPIFFVSIGLNLSFASFTKDIVLILTLTVIAILGKLLGAGFGAKLSGFSLDDSYIVGAGMMSRGEMALIIAQTGFSAGLMTGEYYSAIIFTIVLTTLLSPLILKHAVQRTSKKM